MARVWTPHVQLSMRFVDESSDRAQSDPPQPTRAPARPLDSRARGERKHRARGCWIARCDPLRVPTLSRVGYGGATPRSTAKRCDSPDLTETFGDNASPAVLLAALP